MCALTDGRIRSVCLLTSTFILVTYLEGQMIASDMFRLDI